MNHPDLSPESSADVVHTNLTLTFYFSSLLCIISSLDVNTGSGFGAVGPVWVTSFHINAVPMGHHNFHIVCITYP